jgi:hypothetical protein
LHGGGDFGCAQIDRFQEILTKLFFFFVLFLTKVDLVVIGDVHFFGRKYWERRNVKIFFELFGEDVDGGSLPRVDFDHGDFVFKVSSGVDVLGAM